MIIKSQIIKIPLKELRIEKTKLFFFKFDAIYDKDKTNFIDKCINLRSNVKEYANTFNLVSESQNTKLYTQDNDKINNSNEAYTNYILSVDNDFLIVEIIMKFHIKANSIRSLRDYKSLIFYQSETVDTILDLKTKDILTLFQNTKNSDIEIIKIKPKIHSVSNAKYRTRESYYRYNREDDFWDYYFIYSLFMDDNYDYYNKSSFSFYDQHDFSNMRPGESICELSLTNIKPEDYFYEAKEMVINNLSNISNEEYEDEVKIFEMPSWEYGKDNNYSHNDSDYEDSYESPSSSDSNSYSNDSSD